MAMENKTFLFKVKLQYNKRIYRVIELLGSQTLHTLNYAILNAYAFDSDHLYSFFMDNKAWRDRNKEYCSPQTDGKHADEIMLQDLRLLPKQKFLYLFDYGDEWKFEVEFIGNDKTQQNIKYPRVLKTVGESQEQYG